MYKFAYIVNIGNSVMMSARVTGLLGVRWSLGCADLGRGGAMPVLETSTSSLWWRFHLTTGKQRMPVRIRASSTSRENRRAVSSTGEVLWIGVVVCGGRDLLSSFHNIDAALSRDSEHNTVNYGCKLVCLAQRIYISDYKIIITIYVIILTCIFSLFTIILSCI